METLKNKIKNLSENQTVLRDQRKTIHYKMERTVSPSEATWKHHVNRETLTAMYAAYSILKGKTIEEVHAETPIKKEGKRTILELKNQINNLVTLHINEKIVRFSEQ